MPRDRPPAVAHPDPDLSLGRAVRGHCARFLAWARPDIWFHAFHNAAPASFGIALLRRASGQWAAFALAQAIGLMTWRKRPIWLVVVAGVRFSDLFTDIFYVIAAPSLSTFGWVALLPPPALNLAGVYILLRG